MAATLKRGCGQEDHGRCWFRAEGEDEVVVVVAFADSPSLLLLLVLLPPSCSSTIELAELPLALASGAELPGSLGRSPSSTSENKSGIFFFVGANVEE